MPGTQSLCTRIDPFPSESKYAQALLPEHDPHLSSSLPRLHSTPQTAFLKEGSPVLLHLALIPSTPGTLAPPQFTSPNSALKLLLPRFPPSCARIKTPPRLPSSPSLGCVVHAALRLPWHHRVLIAFLPLTSSISFGLARLFFAGQLVKAGAHLGPSPPLVLTVRTLPKPWKQWPRIPSSSALTRALLRSAPTGDL